MYVIIKKVFITIFLSKYILTGLILSQCIKKPTRCFITASRYRIVLIFPSIAPHNMSDAICIVSIFYVVFKCPSFAIAKIFIEKITVVIKRNIQIHFSCSNFEIGAWDENIPTQRIYLNTQRPYLIWIVQVLRLHNK